MRYGGDSEETLHHDDEMRRAKPSMAKPILAKGLGDAKTQDVLRLLLMITLVAVDDNIGSCW